MFVSSSHLFYIILNEFKKQQCVRAEPQDRRIRTAQVLAVGKEHRKRISKGRIPQSSLERREEVTSAEGKAAVQLCTQGQRNPQRNQREQEQRIIIHQQVHA